MEHFTFAVPCLFGLEGLVGDELRRMNLQNVRVEDRRVFFDGDFADMARANVRLRMGERVMILLARFPARTFEELYQGVKAIPLERFVPREGAFPVKGYSLDSQLHSVPDCQAIAKKAAVDRLGAKYGLSWLPETGETYQLRFSLMKDVCEVFLDTSGVSLHKRGYRAVGNDAPLHETMAAAMVTLARYRGRDFFWDPFCGSGTIAIEAAFAALNRAPGLNRSFGAERWGCVPPEVWKNARQEARDGEFRGNYRILGTDNDPGAIAIAISNAKKAGVAGYIDFHEADALKQRDDLVVALLGVGAHVMDVDALAHDITDGHTRVQAGVRVLEHDLHAAAVGQHVDSDLLFFIKQHLAIVDDGAVGRLVQAQQGTAGGRFAAAGLADQAEGLALANGKAYVIHSLDIALVFAHAASREILLQVLYFNQILAHSALPPFSNSSFWRSQQ